MTTTAAGGDELPPSHDRRACVRCRHREVHVTIEHAPNVDRVTVFRVVGIMPEARGGAGWRITFWTGHEWTIARDVLSEVADLVDAAWFDGYQRGRGDRAIDPRTATGAPVSVLYGEAGREEVRVRVDVKPGRPELPTAKPPRVREGWLAWFRRRLRRPS